MNVYRTPPPVLPSLRELTAAFPFEGSRDAWDEDIDALVPRVRAAQVPCPAFARGPDLRGPRNPRPPRMVRA